MTSVHKRNSKFNPRHTRIQIMDTTLRDGEQTPDIAYTPAEKLQIARKLLCDVRVDRIEVASTRVSKGEYEAAKRIAQWSHRQGCHSQIEVLGYCDGHLSAEWAAEVGIDHINLLTKGSERHCRQQLGLSPPQHFERINETIAQIQLLDIQIRGVYLEDWSNGIRDTPDYVMELVEELTKCQVHRVYLADTLGILQPPQVQFYVAKMTREFPAIIFEFHAHNDYGLATANCLAALQGGALGLHTSVNGLGERSGNARLAEVVASMRDHTNYQCVVDESHLVSASDMVETYSGKLASDNLPVVGRDVFTQTSGIHADGDTKADLYMSLLTPERFGRKRRYALGKLSGQKSLDQNLKALGIELESKERQKVLSRIVELGDKKQAVFLEDLSYIISDVLGRSNDIGVSIIDYSVSLSKSVSATATISVKHGSQIETAEGQGNGGYDALMNALLKVANRLDLHISPLLDFRVRIPPGGKTSALVETWIKWEGSDGPFITIGVDSDQVASAVIATEKMLQNVNKARSDSLKCRGLVYL